MPRSGIFWLSIEGLDGGAQGAPRFFHALKTIARATASAAA
jgi:hypothetical protein